MDVGDAEYTQTHPYSKPHEKQICRLHREVGADGDVGAAESETYIRIGKRVRTKDCVSGAPGSER